jgi:hypothetical protein
MIHKDKKQKGFRAVSSSRRYFILKSIIDVYYLKKCRITNYLCLFKIHQLHEEHNLRLFAQDKINICLTFFIQINQKCGNYVIVNATKSHIAPIILT